MHSNGVLASRRGCFARCTDRRSGRGPGLARCAPTARQHLVLAIAFALGCGQWAIRTDPIIAHPADREAIQLGGVLPCQQFTYQRSKSLRFQPAAAHPEVTQRLKFGKPSDSSGPKLPWPSGTKRPPGRPLPAGVRQADPKPDGPPAGQFRNATGRRIRRSLSLAHALAIPNDDERCRRLAATPYDLARSCSIRSMTASESAPSKFAISVSMR